MLVTDVIRRSDVVSVGVYMTSWLHLALWRLRMDKVSKYLNSQSQAEAATYILQIPLSSFGARRLAVCNFSQAHCRETLDDGPEATDAKISQRLRVES